jgi:hypothetical protein
MNYKSFSIIVVTLFVLNIELFSAISVLACKCETPTICVAYTRAKAVFIGKVEKIEGDKNEPFFPIKVYFSVEKTFKGKTEKNETARFGFGACETNFKVGEKYFVYKEEPSSYCNRTDLLSVLSNDLEYAESLSDTNPIFTLKGVFPQLSENEIVNSKIILEKDQIKYNIELEKNGNFHFKATENGVYKVKILLPFEAEINVKQDMLILTDTVKISSTSSNTTIEYEVKFKPNECDFREFSISRGGKSNMF